MEARKIVIAGGTGHLGSSLADRLIQEGHSVRMFTRKVPKNNSRISYSYWDGETPVSGFEIWTEAMC